MIVVALAAVALVVPGEVRNRRERRRLARSVAHYLFVAAIHDHHRAVCEASDGRKHYDTTRRVLALRSESVGMPEFDGWAGEAAWHAGLVVAGRAWAAKFAREERAIRNRLLLPVIGDNGSPHR